MLWYGSRALRLSYLSEAPELVGAFRARIPQKGQTYKEDSTSPRHAALDSHTCPLTFRVVLVCTRPLHWSLLAPAAHVRVVLVCITVAAKLKPTRPTEPPVLHGFDAKACAKSCYHKGSGWRRYRGSCALRICGPQPYNGSSIMRAKLR